MVKGKWNCTTNHQLATNKRKTAPVTLSFQVVYASLYTTTDVRLTLVLQHLNYDVHNLIYKLFHHLYAANKVLRYLPHRTSNPSMTLPDHTIGAASRFIFTTHLAAFSYPSLSSSSVRWLMLPYWYLIATGIHLVIIYLSKKSCEFHILLLIPFQTFTALTDKYC